ncbi:MAG: dihydroorotate dehydrogenase electron transfer subunit [Gammaproteobacteria bacterium]|jgi:dihydroorotate dehydrogenase electron transfer subunit
MEHPLTRDTINLEDATILEHQAFAGDQYLLRLKAPEIALSAQAGSFVHLRCDKDLAMRRPMSIMRAHKKQGWIDILYKAHGKGTNLLSKQTTGETLSLIGPIGVPFKQSNYKKRPLLIGGGVGIPPMVFLSEHINKTSKNVSPFVIMGSEVPFPFKTQPSQIMVSGMPDGIIAAMPLLEDWRIASRLCSLQGYPGCFDGYVTDLARVWLDSMDSEEHKNIEIFSCGPTPMLAAVALMAKEYGLACQVSLEEYMACGVGGCAACAVRVETPVGPAMKRVCVDGPVFEASTVFS